MKLKVTATLFALLVLCSFGAWAQQASIRLNDSDVAYCYKQDANWTLTKSNDSGYPTAVTPGSEVNWTITATRGADGPKQVCAIGYVSITNTGSAPATIGNIVVDLQRNFGGQGGKWTVIAADVADATNGDAATSDNIVAGALQGQTTYPADIVAVSGDVATFYENAVSGSLSFTDADSNTTWAITPAKTIAVGATVNLFFNAVFAADNISPALTAGEELRTEVFVSFGNAGARGGSGATATNIDVNGDGTNESNVRTVPTRIAKALPSLQICNDTVTVTDTFSTGTATVSLSVNPIGTGVTTNETATYVLTGTVGGSGTLSNTAELKGSDSTVTIGTTPRPCCTAVDLTANSSVLVGSELPPPAGYCSYTQGAFNDKAKGAPAQLLVSNFGSAFSTGLLIGTTPTYNATWTDLAPLRQWLGGGGPSGQLTVNTTNATDTAGGTLAKQVATLTINLALDLNTAIGGLQLTGTGTSLDGSSVTQILAAANKALGTGELPSGYTFGTLNELITHLNESWDNCIQSAWAPTHLQ